MKRLILAISIICLFLTESSLWAQKPFLGAYLKPSDKPKGLRLSTQPGAPADKAGLLDGDVITAFDKKKFKGEGKTWRKQLVDYMNANKKVGSFITLSIDRVERRKELQVNGNKDEREFPLLDLQKLVEEAKPPKEIRFDTTVKRKLFDKRVRLGKRDVAKTLEIAPLADKLFQRTRTMVHLNNEVRKFINAQGIEKDCDDLDRRLQRVASKEDALRPVRLLIDDVTRGHKLVNEIGQVALRNRADALVCLFEKLCQKRAQRYRHHRLSAYRPPKYRDLTSLLKAIEASLTEAHKRIEKAFSALTKEERQFLRDHHQLLTACFAKRNYVNNEPNKRDRRDILKLIEVGNKIDLCALLHSFRPLLWLFDDRHLQKVEQICRYSNLPLEKKTKFGLIIVAGNGRQWHKKEAAVVIDLAGNDFYSLPAAKDVLKNPFQITIDLAGDDYYQTTANHGQGSGLLGHGVLIDRQGKDTYIGKQWVQGSGLFGCGLLADLAGDDTYRGNSFCQGSAVFGLGLLFDEKGKDRYEGHLKCQAFAGAQSVALLVDKRGHDSYYATGGTPTGYGTAGIFDSWSQGCADGFRLLSPGGIAAIIDGSGNDCYEAGNFSQGGGYYYGAGIILDKSGDDRYQGSRYNQGFCAHQAVGIFIDERGNDTYRTHQGVAQGLAWDESATLFIDGQGNDHYEGGGFFSQGTSAHNSKCFFWDRNGRDTYIYEKGQGRAGDNSYHGGTSLTLFIDDGNKKDIYAKGRKNNEKTITGKHGCFIDR